MRRQTREPAPYKGLAHYEESDAILFGGRDAEIEECARLIYNSSTALFVLHGLSGSGKTSFIRAGLLPKLRKFGGFVPMLVMPPCDAAASGGALDELGQAINNLADIVSLEAGRSADRSIAKLRNEFGPRKDKPQFLYDFLVSATLSTPKLPVLFVDQAEQIVRTTKDRGSSEAFIQLLRLLCSRRIDLRICLSMRSEYKAQLDDKLHGAKPFAIAGYCLPEMSKEKLKEAIRVPARVRNPQWKRFKFQQGAIEEIVEKATQKDVIGGPLIAAQIMCDRLYQYVTDEKRPDKIRGKIRPADVFALGHPNEQITKHVQESLYEAFKIVNGQRPPERQRQAIRADRWLRAISQLMVPEVDGRATSTQKSAKDLIPAEEEPHHGQIILRHLSEPREYVLKSTGSDKYTLQHDTIALSLRKWKEAKDAIDPERSLVAGTVVRAANYTVEDLWINSDIKTLRLITVDDNIWDHLVLLYAQNREFSKRLGIELAVPKKFRWTSPRQQGDYSAFFQYRGPRIAILPIGIVQEIPPEWEHLAVSNIFRGYAITGVDDFKNSSTPLVKAFDSYCKDFGRLCAEELKIGAKIQLFKKKADLEGDPLYTWLMENRHPDRFAIGPAPTRARWRQTNQFKEWDISDLLSFANGEQNDIKADLRRLLMHEVCVVSEGLQEEWLYRIAAMVFYTVQYILSDPSDFVSYIFDYEWDLRRGRIPVAQDAIRKTLEKSYRFQPFESQTERYLNPVSKYSLPARSERDKNCRNQIAKIYNDLIRFRRTCDEIFQNLQVNDRLPAHVAKLLRAAEKQYQIYNFYDAAEFCKQAVAELRRT